MSKSRNNRLSSASQKKEAVPKEALKSLLFVADNFLAKDLNDIFHNLPPDLTGWISLYLKLQIEGVKSAHSLRAISNDLQKFVAFFIPHHHGQDLRQWLPRTTQRYLEHLEKKGQKPATIKRALTSIRSLARWVLGLRPDLFPLGDPTKGSKPPVQQAMKPKGLTERQVKRILDAAYHLICQNYPDEKLAKVEQVNGFTKGHRQMRRPFRDYAILMLLLNGGLRRSEICHIQLEQLKGKHLRSIKCKGNLFRDVLLGEETLRTIETYLEEERPRDVEAFSDSNALFLPSSSRKNRNQTGRLSERSINAIVENIADAANQGLPPEEQIKVHPHMFRHTHAYQILKKGRSLPYLQKRLGHLSMNYLALYSQMPETEEQELLDDAEFK